MIIDKDNIKLILIILVVSLGIGYAYINSDLNINGTAKIKNANWDVHWANIQVKSGSVTGSNVVTAPTISNQTTVNFSIVLPTPGDYYEFTVDAVNAGVIDAMIDSINYKLNGATITTLPDYLSYEVTYSDGVELEQNHLLAANTTETYKVKVKYRDDIELSQIPASDQTINLGFTVTYRQANEASEEVPHPTYVYTVNIYNKYNNINIGQAIPTGITQYSSAAEAMAAYSNNPFYLKHVIRNGVIDESYVEFVVTQAMANANSGMTAGTYALRGFDTYDEANEDCISEYFDTTNNICLSPYYENNKATLLQAFGSANCYEQTETGFKTYTCLVSGLYAYAYSNGYVEAGEGSWYCGFFASGSSHCGDGIVS